MIRLALITIAAAAGMAADLGDRVDALIDAHAAGFGFVGIEIADAASGKILYQRNADRLFLPASNFKLLTAALALNRLGEDYRFKTRVVRELSGDVVLAGEGDPSLSGRAFPYQKDAPRVRPLAAIEDLADQVAAHGIQRIDGDIVGDDTLYPWDPYPRSWNQDDALNEDGAPVSALSVNDNVLLVTVRPGANAGDPANLAFSPNVEFLNVENRVTTIPRGAPASVRLRHVAGSRQWTLEGGIPTGRDAFAQLVPIDDPALFAATVFYDALLRRGIAIHGRAVARHRQPGQPYNAAAGDELAVRASPPLRDLLQVMLKTSVNLHAELFLREVGRITRGDGTTEMGLADLASYLKEMGASPEDFRLEDGSGLSRNALLTPRLLVLLLSRVYSSNDGRSKDRDVWMSLLPAGGEDGTLEHRLCCVGDGRGIRAKTGTLARSLALSGYAQSEAHGTLAFSILINNFSASPSDVASWIDKIAAGLLE